MTRFPRFLAAAALAACVAAPAAAQYPYPYPQPYPQTYPPGYGGNVVGSVIDQLLGGYQVNDRQAIRQCAQAALAQAQNQYRPQGYGGYGGGYQQPYGGYGGAMRVTGITDVQRRSSGLRISGMIDSGRGYGGYNQGYGQTYTQGDLNFRCNTDYRGYVTNVRVRPNSYRGY